MKKLLILVILFIFILNSSYSQSDETRLALKKSRIEFIEDGHARMIQPREASKILSNNLDAYAEFKKAKLNYDVAYVFGLTGGFMNRMYT